MPSAEKHFFRPFAVRAVIDTCVFLNTRRWLIPLLDAAEAGHLQPLWSPLIIAEANRLLTWLWLKRRGGDLSEASKRRCSEDAKRMFTHLTRVFRVVEDCPPPEACWTENPADEWDVPIWTAAVRGEAKVIVTANLKDGPPKDDLGFQQYGGIYFLHPDEFLRLLDIYTDSLAAAGLPELEGEVSTTPVESAVAMETGQESLGRLLWPEAEIKWFEKLLTKNPPEG